MKTTIKIFILRLLNVVVFGFLIIIFLLNISATTIGFVKQKELMLEIQKRDLTIDALLISCEMDWLIKKRRPEYNEDLRH